MKRVLLLGGYGNFGKRISESLCLLTNVTLFICGRNKAKSQYLVESLKKISAADLKAISLDIYSETFEQFLVDLKLDLVIHTSGPFQGQDHRVAQASINAGAHYIDLADDRDFVCGINSLDEIAKSKNLLVVSGASSVPGLSSTVIDHFKEQFTEIESIDMAIAPGNKAERGEATIRGILSYTGHPFKVFKNGQWQDSYGWMDSKQADMGNQIGKRWLANVDVPDLALFPDRYQVKQRVTFQAGLEVSILHLTMVAMAWMAKKGLVKDWSPMTGLIAKTANWFNYFGTDKGGMQIVIKGKDHQGKNKSLTWRLFADNGIGPYIPTISAVLIARKLIAGDINEFGALPCLGLYQLNEFEEYVRDLDIFMEVVEESFN